MPSLRQLRHFYIHHLHRMWHIVYHNHRWFYNNIWLVVLFLDSGWSSSCRVGMIKTPGGLLPMTLIRICLFHIHIMFISLRSMSQLQTGINWFINLSDFHFAEIVVVCWRVLFIQHISYTSCCSGGWCKTVPESILKIPLHMFTYCSC